MYNSNFEVILNVFAYFCDLNCLFPLGDKNRSRMLGKTIFTSQARPVLTWKVKLRQTMTIWVNTNRENSSVRKMTSHENQIHAHIILFLSGCGRFVQFGPTECFRILLLSDQNIHFPFINLFKWSAMNIDRCPCVSVIPSCVSGSLTTSGESGGGGGGGVSVWLRCASWHVSNQHGEQNFCHFDRSVCKHAAPLLSGCPNRDAPLESAWRNVISDRQVALKKPPCWCRKPPPANTILALGASSHLGAMWLTPVITSGPCGQIPQHRVAFIVFFFFSQAPN